MARNIRNPRFNQQFKITRVKGESVTGRFQETKRETRTITGVICPMKTKELELLPEGDRNKGGITIYTLEPLYGTRLNQKTGKDGYFADEVTYHGEQWKVVDDSNRSESGFYKANAVRKLGA